MEKQGKEIPARFNELEKLITMLSEDVNELNSTLNVVVSQEGSSDGDEKSQPVVYSCEMAEKLGTIVHAVGEIRHRVMSIHSRLQI